MTALTRRSLLDGGTPTWVIDDQVRRGVLRVVHEGIYANDRSWESDVAAHVLRGGPGSAISHRAAARLHRLDGFEDSTFDDVTVPASSSFRAAPAVRAVLAADDTQIVDGMRVTTVHRTLLDLGRFIAVDGLEIALESALRGPDRQRPDAWNEPLLAALNRSSRIVTRRRGLPVIREALARRPVGARPTGSVAETLALQALRKVGLGDLLRQPTFEFAASRWARRRSTYFPDFFDPQSGVVIEIDGRDGHAGEDERARDAQRDRVLGDVVRVLRFPAREVMRDGDVFATSVARVVSARRSTPWTSAGARVAVDGNDVQVRVAA